MYQQEYINNCFRTFNPYQIYLFVISLCNNSMLEIITIQRKPIIKQIAIIITEVETAVPTILTVDIQIIGRAVNLTAKALAEDVVIFIVDTNFIANFGVEVKTITIILTVATYKEVIFVEITLRIKGLTIDIAVTIYINSLESIISIIRKVAGL